MQSQGWVVVVEMSFQNDKRIVGGEMRDSESFRFCSKYPADGVDDCDEYEVDKKILHMFVSVSIRIVLL